MYLLLFCHIYHYATIETRLSKMDLGLWHQQHNLIITNCSTKAAVAAASKLKIVYWIMKEKHTYDKSK
jgi:hypothetical protein